MVWEFCCQGGRGRLGIGNGLLLQRFWLFCQPAGRWSGKLAKPELLCLLLPFLDLNPYISWVRVLFFFFCLMFLQEFSFILALLIRSSNTLPFLRCLPHGYLAFLTASWHQVRERNIFTAAYSTNNKDVVGCLGIQFWCLTQDNALCCVLTFKHGYFSDHPSCSISYLQVWNLYHSVWTFLHGYYTWIRFIMPLASVSTMLIIVRWTKLKMGFFFQILRGKVQSVNWKSSASDFHVYARYCFLPSWMHYSPYRKDKPV